MAKKWLTWINFGIVILAGFFFLLAGIITLFRPSKIDPEIPVKENRSLPKHGFQQPEKSYKQLNQELLLLHTAPPSAQLPNLKNIISYFGKNTRPDAKQDQPMIHLNLSNSKNFIGVLPKQKIYLSYDRTSTPPKYVSSPNNAPTPLWIEAEASSGQVTINVFMIDEHGNVIRKPKANSQFTLPEKEYSRYGGNVWEMGSWRVDGTLLARQKAHWNGPDLFLEHHGGKEYAFAKGKQRIDFGEGEDIYSIFIGENDCVIWKDNRWQEISTKEDTSPYPLMCTKKIDTRLINFDLWDVEGRGKIVLNLLKSMEPPFSKTIQQTLKFIGARTLTKFLFEANDQRFLLRPHDWLIYKDGKWELLNDPTMIKRYVNRQLIGPMFVFDGVARKDDRQILKGMLYNPSRTEAVEIDIPLVPSGSNAIHKKEMGKKKIPAKISQKAQEIPKGNGGNASKAAASPNIKDNGDIDEN